MFKPLKTALKKIGLFFWALFFNGLMTILPLTITVVLLHTTVKFIRLWLDPLHAAVQKSGWFSAIPVPYAEVIAIALGIFALGALLNIVILRSLVHKIEALIFKVPLVRAIYSGIKQLVTAFSLQDKFTFKYVVFVEFPRKGMYSVGFLTSELPKEMAPDPSMTFFNVFVPTTPNPTSGYYLILPQKDIIKTDLTRQEAMALIISGGIIQPERYVKKNNENRYNNR